MSPCFAPERWTVTGPGRPTAVTATTATGPAETSPPATTISNAVAASAIPSYTLTQKASSSDPSTTATTHPSGQPALAAMSLRLAATATTELTASRGWEHAPLR